MAQKTRISAPMIVAPSQALASDSTVEIKNTDLKDYAEPEKRLEALGRKLEKVTMKQEDMKRTQAIVHALQEPSASSDDICDLLQELQEICEDIDRAGDLNFYGGLRVVMDLSQHSSADVRRDALFVLGTSAQNNPKVQGHLQDLNVMPLLLQLLKDEEANQVLRKLILALSAVIKNQPEFIKAFVDSDGTKLLFPLLQCTDANVVQRVLFLLAQLSQQDDAIRLAIVDGPILKSLVSFAASTQPDLLEKAVHALHAALQNDTKSLRSALDLGLEPILRDILPTISKDEEDHRKAVVELLVSLAKAKQ